MLFKTREREREVRVLNVLRENSEKERYDTISVVLLQKILVKESLFFSFLGNSKKKKKKNSPRETQRTTT